jgi:hypothetical protein
VNDDEAEAVQTHRGHRGAHPEDTRLFRAAALPDLRAAVADLSWLLTRGYTGPSALTLVGDRYRLHERQRRAVGRGACSDVSLARREAARLTVDKLCGQELAVDGFNLLITVEAALGGGVLLRGRDGCIRDLSSVHGSYRTVQETESALILIGRTLAPYGLPRVTWLLDKPVSNSGRLAQIITDLAAGQDWPWQAELLFSPDRALMDTERIIVTTDSNVLDHAAHWANLWDALNAGLPNSPWLLDLKE